MQTMGAYAPRANDGDPLDSMALTLRGRRRWPRQADLDSLAHLCGVSSVEKENWYERLPSMKIELKLEHEEYMAHHRSEEFKSR